MQTAMKSAIEAGFSITNKAFLNVAFMKDIDDALVFVM
jgi:hypothetical protein